MSCILRPRLSQLSPRAPPTDKHARGQHPVRLARRFEAGTVLAIDVQGKDETVLQTLMARVVHVMLQNDGSWLLGCAFNSPLGEEDLKALL